MSAVPFTPALKAKLEVLLGERGNAMDAAVRKRELVQTRDALRAYAATVGPEGGGTGGGIGSEEYEELSHRIDNALILIDAAQADANAAAIVASNALSAANAAGAYTDDAVQQARDDLAMDYQAAVDAATNAANSAAAANTSAGLSAAAKDGAEAAAAASINARGEAVAAAGDAGSYAAASEASKIAADTAKGQAETARNDAVTAKNDADGARVGAMSAMEMSARIASRGTSVMADPFLQSPRWSVVGAAGNVTMLASEQYPVGKTWVIAAPANNDTLGIMLNGSDAEDWPGQAGALGYVIEVEATTAGNLMNAGVRLSWRASSGSEWFADVLLTAMRSGAAPPGGKMTTFRGVFTRPAGFTGTFSRHDLWVYGTAPFGNPRTLAMTLRVHRINVRVATEEEMGAGKVMDAVQAKLTSEYMTGASTTQAIADMKDTVTADFAGTVASAERSATALAGLNGTVARFKDVVTVNGEKQAGIEAVAWDGAGAGTGSVVKLIGDQVVALGTLSAGALTVGLGGNLVANSDFLDGIRNWQLSGTGTVGIVPAGSPFAHPGAPTLRLSNTAAQSGNSPSVLYKPETDDTVLPGGEAKPGQTYIGSAYLATDNCQARTRLEFLDAAGGLLSPLGSYTAWTTAEPGAAANSPDEWPRLVCKAKAPANTRYWCLRMQKSAAITSGAASAAIQWHPQVEEVEESASQPGPWRSGKIGMFTGDRLFAHSIQTYHLDVEWMTAGRISAAYLDVDGLLTIHENAGLSYGKGSAGDNTDGIYFGVSSNGFGLSASRTMNDRRQRLRLLESSGLELLNARHFVSGTTADVIVTHTANVAKTALPAGISRIQIDMVAGGGGGQKVTSIIGGNPTYATGNPGADTVVRLYDGATLKHEFTAAGAAGSWSGGKGQDSPWGTGGSQGYNKRVGSGDDSDTYDYPGAPGSGYGAGGGGPQGGRGGRAGQFVSSDTIDVSGWAAPMIEIVIGAGGAGHAPWTGSHGRYNSGKGAPGRLRYTWSADQDIPADVVPLLPTAQGSFVKTANVAGSFPDLGAGLWIIYEDYGNPLTLGVVTLGNWFNQGMNTMASMTFISAKTPTYSGGPNTRTVVYRHFSMGNWG